jgi:uncharacterized protein YfaS (alpha-2-macroglobulin family)
MSLAVRRVTNCLALLIACALPVAAQDTLHITRVSPAGVLQPSSRIDVSFNAPLASQLEGLGDPARFVRITPAIPARIDWRDPATIRIAPDSALPPGTEITVAIDTFSLPSGVRLASRWQRTWRVPPPMITASLPLLAASRTTPLDVDARIQLLVRGVPDTAMLARRTAFVAPVAGPACDAWPATRRVGVRVAVRPPSADDPYPLRRYVAPSDSADARFDQVVELTPVDSLPEGCLLDLTLGGVTAADGRTDETRYRLRTAPPPSLLLRCAGVGDCVARRVLEVHSPAPIAWEALRASVRFEPADAVTWPDSAGPRTAWSFAHRLNSRDTVRLIVAPGLRDVHGRTVPSPPPFVVPDRIAAWGAHTGLVVLRPTDESSIAVRHVAIDSARVTVYHAPSDPLAILRDPRALTGESGTVWRDSVRYTVPLTTSLNEERLTAIPLRLPRPAWRRDLLGVRIEAVRIGRGGRPSPLIMLVQHSDLIAHTRVHANGGAVFVTGASGVPMSGVQVHALGADGERVVSTRTDRDGLARLDAPPRPQRATGGTWPYAEIVAVELTSRRDRLLVPTESGPRGYGRGRSVTDEGPVDPRYQHAAIVTDRELYRPGELLHATAVVRDGWSDSLHAVRGERVRWRLTAVSAFGDEGETLATREGTLGSHGLASDSFPLPSDGLLGQYRLSLDRRQADRWEFIEGQDIEVREFRPRELSVSAVFDRDEVVTGDTLRATLRATLLLDAPLSDAEVEWYIEAVDTDPWDAPEPGLPPGWTSGDPFTHDPGSRREERAEGTSRTSADGTIRLAWATDVLRERGGGRVSMVASVRDLTGQQVTSSATATVLGSARRIVFRRSSRWGQTLGKVDTVRFGVVDRAGRWVDDVPLRLTVVHRRRDYGSGRGGAAARTVLDTIQRVEVRSRDSSGTFPFIPSRPGESGILFETVDEDGRTIRGSMSIYVIAPNPLADSAGFPFALNRDSASVGDEITLAFESPWPDAEAWILVARDRVLRQSRIRVRGGRTAVPLRVDPTWIPSATISVMLVRRGEPVEQAPLHERYRVQEGELVVGAESKRLLVRIRPREPEVRPGASTLVDVDLRDAAGRPVAGEVVLWAVDEGVLALTDYEPPDPLTMLLTERHWSVATLSSSLTASRIGILLDGPSSVSKLGFSASLQLSQVVVTSNSDEGWSVTAVPSDSTQADDTRRRFRTTAFYRSGIPVGPTGSASVRVQLPDGITTYRLMAVAVDRGDRFGSGVGTLVATKPLIARPALPRFVRAADTFAAGVVINARGLHTPIPVAVGARAEGAVSLLGAAEHQVVLGASGTRADFEATAARGHTARLEFSAVSDSLRDGVAVELPVREDQSPEVSAVVASVRDSATLRLPLPSDVDAARSRLDVRVGASPLPVLRAWSTRLDGERSDFTYAVLFTARSLVALLRLQGNAAIAPVDSAASHRRLEIAVATLVSRVAPDGQVRLWPNAVSPEGGLDAAVGMLLMDARALGVRISETTIQALANTAEQRLARSPLLPDTTYGDAEERRRIVAWHLAARLATLEFLQRQRLEGGTTRGASALDSVAALVPLADRMAFEDQARLVRLLPPGEAAQRMLAGLWRNAQVRGERVDIPDSVLALGMRRSRISPFARLLEATRKHAPDHPMLGALVQRIIQQVQAGGTSRWNGEDYASAVEAVAASLRDVASTDAAVTVQDAMGRTILASAAGSDPPDLQRSLDSLVTPSDRGREVALRVHASGAPVYVSVTAQVLRMERPIAATDRGLAVERWYERVRDGRIVTEVEEGELVRVHLRLSASAAREFVLLEDLLPAGLEVVDPHHRGTGAEQARALEERRAAPSVQDDPWRFTWWRWNPWDHVERRDDRLVVHSRGLPAGVHTYTYLVRATTSGRFVRPRATAREYFNPGLEGSSEGGWFTVTPRRPR